MFQSEGQATPPHAQGGGPSTPLHLHPEGGCPHEAWHTTVANPPALTLASVLVPGQRA